MPTLSFATDSFFSPTFVSPACIPTGSLTWLLATYEAHPERFPNGPPVVHSIPNAVYINPPSDDGKSSLNEAQ